MPRTGHARDAAARCYGETTAGKGCALSCRASAGYRDRPTTVTRTSTHCGSPLLMKTRGAYAPDISGVNGKTKACAGCSARVQDFLRIVPTLCVGMQPGTLRVPPKPNAERPLRHSHAERGNDRNDQTTLHCGSGLARDGGVTGAADFSWPSPTADPPPTAAHGAGHAHTASRQSRPRGSAAPTARCRSGHGWPGRSPACRCRPCSAHR